ncbi:gustatory and odorant receptor 22-like [Thrips palmi]|uniref:Gustatory receptor n=1 Tax=Thrips palmi TaxID=161013 RepID=A0A6P9A0K3_THRPL|nr:gustatory and odorant receptor 22-like [Thrips palmi]
MKQKPARGGPKGGPPPHGTVLTLAEEMKPLLLVMRLINIMPLHFTADGGAYFSWRSSMMLLSAAGWALAFVDVVYETVFRIDVFVSSLSHFSEAVFNMFFFLLLHHHYFTPVLHWPAAPRFADYLSDWAHFQARFLAETGRPLRLAVRSLATHKASACLGVPCVLAVPLSLGIPTSNWHNVPLGLLAAAFHASVPAFWDVLGTAAVNASDQLTACFKEVGGEAAPHLGGAQGPLQGPLSQEVAVSGGEPPAARVRAYRELWLELRRLAEDAPAAWGICTLHYMLCCISAVLLNGFGLLAAATNGGEADMFLTCAMFLIMVDSLWHTAVVCASGQQMAAAVDSGTRDVLLKMRMSTSTTATLLLQREVISFLNVMKKPLTISLYGFIALKLTLVVTIVETLATYLCVLLQFTINFQRPSRGSALEAALPPD